MCLGEGGADTLEVQEQDFLRKIAQDRFPAYDFQLCRNEEAMTWVVLQPAQATVETPRFTFCRIDPCVMVMVEDRGSARRFCSVPSVQQAVAFALETARRGAAAVRNVHDAPDMPQ